jgi:hypothetical protein
MTIFPPLVIKLGEARDTQLMELYGESGQLLEEVREVLRLVHLKAPEETADKVCIPIVATYRLGEPRTKDNKTISERATRSMIKQVIFLAE